MTEIERLKKENFPREEFWNMAGKECHTVKEADKEKWAIWLDLYVKLKSVCDKEDLEYFVIYDTLLGAVRYNCFIPNATDINICMPRASYERLMRLDSRFEHPYFLQNPHTDKNYGYSFAKLCNSNTTVHVKAFENCEYNHGMVLDIFPLDKIDPKEYKVVRRKIYELIMCSSAKMRFLKSVKSDRDIQVISQYYNEEYSFEDLYEEIQKIADQFNDKETGYVSTLTYTGFEEKKCLWTEECFENSVELPFCGITLRIPSGYDEILKKCYGNDYIDKDFDYQLRWNDVKYYPNIPYKEFYSGLKFNG